ncbi:hypothetical protein LEMLEM_LOCUS24746, partial [Lemmus lemmus]
MSLRCTLPWVPRRDKSEVMSLQNGLQKENWFGTNYTRFGSHVFYERENLILEPWTVIWQTESLRISVR